MKFKFKKATIIAGIAVLGLVGAGAAIAGAGHNSPEQKLRWVERVVTHKLDLNEDQQAKLGEVKQAVLDAKQRHHKKKPARFAEVENMILSDELDEELITEMIDEHRNRMDEEAPKVLELVKEFHSSLSDEQKQKAVDALRKMKERHGH